MIMWQQNLVKTGNVANKCEVISWILAKGFILNIHHLILSRRSFKVKTIFFQCLDTFERIKKLVLKMHLYENATRENFVDANKLMWMSC